MNSSITMNKGRKIQTVLFLGILVLLPSLVMGECTCELEEGDNNKHEALKYKGAAIASILVACAIGVCIPMLGKIIPALQPDKDLFFMIKAFAAGVILATGFVHVLPDAFDHLTSPCLSENPWGNFPFTGFVAMLSAIGTLMVDAFATCYYSKSDDQIKKAQPLNGDDVHIHTHSTHGSPEAGAGAGAGSEDLVRHRVISQVLELGIVVHSVIIGISLGASESPKTIKPLFVALTFHQFFEGIGLGGCISQAKFKPIAVAVMALSFCLTTPVGIVIGIGITNVYKENSPTALIVEGILNAASAGILIYMALVDLLAADFMNAKMQNNRKLQLEANVSLLLGAALMSLLAKWA